MKSEKCQSESIQQMKEKLGMEENTEGLLLIYFHCNKDVNNEWKFQIVMFICLLENNWIVFLLL